MQHNPQDASARSRRSVRRAGAHRVRAPDHDGSALEADVMCRALRGVWQHPAAAVSPKGARGRSSSRPCPTRRGPPDGRRHLAARSRAQVLNWLARGPAWPPRQPRQPRQPNQWSWRAAPPLEGRAAAGGPWAGEPPAGLILARCAGMKSRSLAFAIASVTSVLAACGGDDSTDSAGDGGAGSAPDARVAADAPAGGVT